MGTLVLQSAVDAARPHLASFQRIRPSKNRPQLAVTVQNVGAGHLPLHQRRLPDSAAATLQSCTMNTSCLVHPERTHGHALAGYRGANRTLSKTRPRVRGFFAIR